MKKVIITGATGMLGVALINRLLKENIEVVAVVRPNSVNISNLPKNKKIRVVQYDISELSKLSYLEKNFDAFFHFAWNGTFGESRNDVYLQNLNVKYTLDAVKIANELGCEVFIGAGSQAEYGRVSNIISPDTPVDPENGYGIAKYTAGKLSRIYAEKLGIRHIWTRIFSVYGPYNGDNTMIISTIRSLLNGEKPSLSKGEQMWDYLHCDDAAEAFYLLAKKGLDQSVYCVGSGQAAPLSEYFHTIRDAIDPSLPLGIGEVPYGSLQVMHLCADITTLKEDTGYNPSIEFKDGIKDTIGWYRKEKYFEKN